MAITPGLVIQAVTSMTLHEVKATSHKRLFMPDSTYEMSRTSHFQTVQWGFLGRDGDEELLINGIQVTLGDRKVSPVVIAAQPCVVLHDTELCSQMVLVLSFMLYISYNNN